MMLFNQLALFVGNISSNIRYCANDVYSVLHQEYTNADVPFVGTTLKNLKDGYNMSESWSMSVDSINFNYGLSKADKDIIKQFGYKLGATDVEGQTDHCEYFKDVFENKAKELKVEYSEKAKVYRSLGLFSGLALVIVML